MYERHILVKKQHRNLPHQSQTSNVHRSQCHYEKCPVKSIKQGNIRASVQTATRKAPKGVCSPYQWTPINGATEALCYKTIAAGKHFNEFGC